MKHTSILGGDYHDRWQGEFQSLLRKVPDEDGEVGADASPKSKEEEDKDGDGDVVEGAVPLRKVLSFVNPNPYFWILDLFTGTDHWWEEEVVDGHRCRASCQDGACHDQQNSLTHQPEDVFFYRTECENLVRGADRRLPKRLQVRKAVVAIV